MVQKKLCMCYGRTGVNRVSIYEMFLLLDSFLTEHEINTETIASTDLNHIQQLSHYFHEYFGADDVSMFD